MGAMRFLVPDGGAVADAADAADAAGAGADGPDAAGTDADDDPAADAAGAALEPPPVRSMGPGRATQASRCALMRVATTGMLQIGHSTLLGNRADELAFDSADEADAGLPPPDARKPMMVRVEAALCGDGSGCWEPRDFPPDEAAACASEPASRLRFCPC